MGILKTIWNELPRGRRTFSGLILSLLFDQPFKIMVNIRLGQRFRRSPNPLLRLYSRWLKNRQMYRWSCDIAYSAKIGTGVKFLHPIGIVVGTHSVIGNNVRIWQNVTLGSHGRDGDKDYPTIGDGARLYAGAIIIGGITVGKDAVVAANAVVNIDVPDDCIAAGIPCKIINKKK
ncbi:MULTISPECIES: serine O-acetyltransferase [unclassified Flavobacterium]|uniref:serine O-acetyltransferase n=1 Tax=unclassified Flavobacterium TaxID=196869 RepID=UPI001F13FA3C|nr:MULTISPECIES: serine acetyltransferase [unclassified Flavobacterium]UMY65843.1 serine acetyltransferase [Flavobacterium sp. HJ-32-4]